ncbi:MAG: 4-alpha-glucanotransferase [Syntrophorhabdaceae bacterium]|nr:4-alpha-glucanotransferase [Syntrophorhabdaceae bacterium]
MIKMVYTEDFIWEKNIELEGLNEQELVYSYALIDNNNGTTINDGAGKRRIPINPLKTGNSREVIIRDTWLSPSDPSTLFFTSFFTDVIFKNDVIQKEMEEDLYEGRYMETGDIKAVVKLKVFAPWACQNKAVYVTGNCPELGDWDIFNAPLMKRDKKGMWSIAVYIDRDRGPIEYKYIIKEKGKDTVLWEDGGNRHIDKIEGDTIFINDNIFRCRVSWRGAGVAVPVFSLRSKDSLGTGEFTDLKHLADWASEAGLRVIQILPVNDTTRQHSWMDAYPYSCISVFALHPLYLNLDAIGGVSEDIKREVDYWRYKLNSSESLEYEDVMRVKLDLARRIFHRQKDDFLESEAFKDFFNENAFWLKSYALFCVLRDKNKTGDFTKWGRFKSIKKEEIDTFVAPGTEYFHDICFYYFIQYHLHLQLLDASLYARKKGVAIKGDIPIGVHPESHDCWIMPEIFHMDRSAGAPPDPFSDHGQNWGFPTYNWDIMAEDDYKWWRSRLEKMSMYFQMVRLDHILGFFRIWEIPKGTFSGLMGRFNPAIPIKKEELEKEGIRDIERLWEPHIPSWYIYEVFGEYGDYVSDTFLEEKEQGLFRVRPEFSTQARIEEYLSSLDETQEEDRRKKAVLRDGLFRLISNIIFIRDEKYEGFHFRINMMNTASFTSLEEWMRKRLIHLYNDYFYHRQDGLWRSSAMEKLPVLKTSSPMLICGEDLGMIPDCVPPVMEELCILGLRIQRMPKESDREFGYPWDYHYLTVCTTSSHDMSTIRGWWEENPEKVSRYYRSILGHDGDPPKECTPEICQEVIMQHLESPSMFAIFPIQDLLGMSAALRWHGNPKAEQINNPADPFHRWRYRMHINIEDLKAHLNFTEMIKTMLIKTGRVGK